MDSIQLILFIKRCILYFQILPDKLLLLFSKFSSDNYAYLKFCYANPHFKKFKQTLAYKNYYTANVGDYIQSIAIKNLYKMLKITPFSIDRETCSRYSGSNVKLFCNAIFYPNEVPSSKIEPIFLGFSLADTPTCIDEYQSALLKNAPIGCRDFITYKLLKQKNIPAFISGCYSITLPAREKEPELKKIFFVGISEELKKHIPHELLPYSEFINQRKIQHNFPLTDKDMRDTEKEAFTLLERYKNEATLVVSPLLHCITPCIGMGIPVILARDEYNPRFSAIEKITKLYLKEDYSSIDWNPKTINVDTIKLNMVKIAKYKLQNKEIPQNLIDYFNRLFLPNTTWPIELYPQLNDIMERRITRMLDLIKNFDIKSIMDLGCGEQNLKKYINKHIQYYPIDAFKLKETTILKDFNNGEFLNEKVDIAFCSGIFEYIKNLDNFVQNISKNATYILGSYIFYEDRPIPDYVICHYKQHEFWEIFKKHGFKVLKIIKENTYNDIGKNTLFLLKKENSK